MMRVPGSKEDLLSVKARGADIRMLYTPLDALSLAEENPDKEIVFFAIGFETTAPVHLMALKEAIRRGLPNFSILTSLFTVPPAIEAILSDPESKVDGFLTAGHVCAITGNRAYHRLTARYKIPMVVTGFEPVDLLYGIYRCVSQLEAGSYEVENAYKRAVPEQGNAAARQLMDEMLEPCDQDWRGIGIIPSSGLQLRSEYKRYSSRMRFQSVSYTHLDVYKRQLVCLLAEAGRDHDKSFYPLLPGQHFHHLGARFTRNRDDRQLRLRDIMYRRIRLDALHVCLLGVYHT